MHMDAFVRHYNIETLSQRTNRIPECEPDASPPHHKL
jgi:hypothetical protein